MSYTPASSSSGTLSRIRACPEPLYASVVPSSRTLSGSPWNAQTMKAYSSHCVSQSLPRASFGVTGITTPPLLFWTAFLSSDNLLGAPGAGVTSTRMLSLLTCPFAPVCEKVSQHSKLDFPLKSLKTPLSHFTTKSAGCGTCFRTPSKSAQP